MLTVITDPGVDDLIALTLLSKLYPEDCSLISSFGNVSHEYTSLNTKEFLSFAVPQWLYYSGASQSLAQKQNTPWAENYHGKDGTWGVHPQSNIDNVKEVHKIPFCDSIVSLGPLTDLAELINPSIKSVTIMGGAFNVKGNETAFSEFNIASDPHSAKLFFETVNSGDIKVVPLDATSKVKWTKDQIFSIKEKNEIGSWLKQLLLAWFENYKQGESEYFELYDPLTIYLHFYPEYAVWKTDGISIVAEGDEIGRTIISQKTYPCKIAIDILNPETVSQKIYNLLFL